MPQQKSIIMMNSDLAFTTEISLILQISATGTSDMLLASTKARSDDDTRMIEGAVSISD